MEHLTGNIVFNCHFFPPSTSNRNLEKFEEFSEKALKPGENQNLLELHGTRWEASALTSASSLICPFETSLEYFKLEVKSAYKPNGLSGRSLSRFS